jgi:NhaA family Na+:H+ antiporter
MSLFVAALAFDEGSLLHNEAKAGILVGSTLSAIVGFAVLRVTTRLPRQPAADVVSAMQLTKTSV